MTRTVVGGGTPPGASLELRQARAFGLSVGTVLGLFAAWNLWRGRPLTAGVFGFVALVLLTAGVAVPAILRRPSAWWHRLALGLAWVNTRLILSVFFVVVLTPVGLVMRAVGRDPLGRRRRRDPTGWVTYSARQRNPRHYERMY